MSRPKKPARLGEIPRGFLERFNRARSEAGLDPNAFAGRMRALRSSASPKTVQGWSEYRSLPDGESLWVISEAMQWSLDYLFFGEGVLERGVTVGRQALAADLLAHAKSTLPPVSDQFLSPVDFLPDQDSVVALAVDLLRENGSKNWQGFVAQLRAQAIDWAERIRDKVPPKYQATSAAILQAVASASDEEVARGAVFVAVNPGFLRLDLPPAKTLPLERDRTIVVTPGPHPGHPICLNFQPKTYVHQVGVGVMAPGQPYTVAIRIGVANEETGGFDPAGPLRMQGFVRYLRSGTDQEVAPEQELRFVGQGFFAAALSAAETAAIGSLGLGAGELIIELFTDKTGLWQKVPASVLPEPLPKMSGGRTRTGANRRKRQ